LLSPLSLLQAVKEEHLSNLLTDMAAKAEIADQPAAKQCHTVQHGIKEEPTCVSAPTINPKPDPLALIFASGSGQEIPLASDAVKQEATCCAFSTCGQSGATASFWQDDSQAVSDRSPPDVTEEAITDHGDMLAAAVAHSSGTASQSMTMHGLAQRVQGTMTRGALPVSPTTVSTTRADPSSVKVCTCLLWWTCHIEEVHIVLCCRCASYAVLPPILLLMLAW